MGVGSRYVAPTSNPYTSAAANGSLGAGRPSVTSSAAQASRRAPSFPSVLFLRVEDSVTTEKLDEPSTFRDLNLDQVVTSITAGFGEYHLEPFFHARPKDIESVGYRQEVMRELEDQPVMGAIQTFAKRIRAMRERIDLASKRHYKQQKERTFLGAVEIYCAAARGLSDDLERLELRSRGMRSFREYLRHCMDSGLFKSLVAEIDKLKSDLATIRYNLLLRSDIEVRPYEEAEDYSAVIERTFARFRRGAAKEYRAELRTYSDMNHIEAAILDRVAKLNPEVFQRLEAFCANHSEFVDEGISRFDREVHFYVAYLAFIGRPRETGLPFCYPRLSGSSKEIACRETFDLALATRQVGEHTPVVTNEFHLRGRERIFVVTGPNQGGKTTFARTFGQLHYLASLGCAVPGSEARLFFFDRLFTHFEREEVAANLRGKLRDDLIRIRQILEEATPNSLVIMNEIFASTTVKDAVFLGTEVMERLCVLDVLAVCVTFLSELATLDVRTVSLTSTVDPADPAVRTFKVVRSPATGLAYALAIARKHQVSYDQIKERLQP
jgi:DNA mismatch repair protein MutS